MKKIIMIVALILSISAMGAAPKQKTTFMVTQKNPIVTVTLSSNPGSTGYSWFLAGYPHDLIKPLSAKYSPPANSKLIGAPGTMTWRFKVLSSAFTVPQVMRIKLVNMRPWAPKSGEKKLIWIVSGN